MKKLLALLMAGMMVLSLTACGGGETGGEPENNNAPVAREPAGVKVELTDVEKKVSANIYYPETGVLDVVEYSDSKSLIQENGDYKIDFYLCADDRYEKIMKYNKMGSDFAEGKFGEYDSYSCIKDGKYTVVVLFEKADGFDSYLQIMVESGNSENTLTSKEIFDTNAEVKAIIESVVYNGKA